jgi:hypothetical protein
VSTEPRTVRVNILRTYRLDIPEPDWCTGHDDIAQRRVDLMHFGPEHRLTFNGDELFKLMLAQTPYARNAGRGVEAYVEQAHYTGSLDTAGLYDLAAALDHAADQLRAFADQHADLLDGGGR